MSLEPVQARAEARWPWWLVAALAAVDLVWLAATPLSLDAESWRRIALLGCAVATLMVLAGRAELSERRRTFIVGLSLMLAAWPALRAFNHLTMTLGLPLADARLAAWDAMIGFDWLAYIRWLDGQPALMSLMDAAYSGLTAYSCLTFLFLLVAAGPKPAREFVHVFLVTAVIAAAVGALLPANAAMLHYAPDLTGFRHVAPDMGTYHYEALHRLRADPDRVLSLSALPGLVTFPSFHTAMGVIAIWCARAKLWVLVPVAAVNLVMIASTPLFGSHYLVDVIAGAALALAVALALQPAAKPRPETLRRGRARFGSAEAVR